MNDMTMFARLRKYDEATGYFEAVAANESVDKADEVFDYDTSKPEFAEWSGKISKATDGKSLGNLREMHGKVAAGRVIEITFDDVNKAIIIKGEAVDEGTKTKMKKGVLTGVSIGGDYVKKWPDPANKSLIRYTAKPAEISLVDNPCNPSCHFTVVKADGMTEERHFDGAVIEQATGQVWTCAVKGHEHGKKEEASKCSTATTESLRRGILVADVRPEFAKSIGVDLAKLSNVEGGKGGGGHPASGDGQKTVEQLEVEKNLDPRVKDFDAGQMAIFEKCLPAIKTQKALTAIVTKIAARESVLEPEVEDLNKGNTTYADPINKKYPIDTAAHIRAAWNYIHKAKNAAKYSADDVTAMKAKIVTAWKDKIDKAGPPSASDDAADKTVVTLSLRKGLYAVASLADKVEQLNWLLESYQYEQTMEGDDSEACAMLEDGLHTLLRALAAMAKEETDEMMGNADVDVMALSASIGDMAKALKVDLEGETMFIAPAAWDKVMKDAAFAKLNAAEAPKRAELAKSLGMTLGKIGARHSKGDKAHLQAIHDHSTGMGAECDHSDCGDGDDADKSARAGKLAKVTTEREGLQKQVGAIAKALDLPETTADVLEPVTKVVAELKKLKAMPAPAKGNVLDISPINDVDPTKVGKGETKTDDTKPILKADGSVDQEANAQRAIRRVHGFRT